FLSPFTTMPISTAWQRTRTLAANLRREADAATGSVAARIGAHVTAAERAAATRHVAMNFTIEFLIRLLMSGVDICKHRQVATRPLFLMPLVRFGPPAQLYHPVVEPVGGTELVAMLLARSIEAFPAREPLDSGDQVFRHHLR